MDPLEGSAHPSSKVNMAELWVSMEEVVWGLILLVVLQYPLKIDVSKMNTLGDDCHVHQSLQ